jgi:tRNA 2-selenouridine synthase
LIGWRARQLEGGYKTYRRWVLDTLEVLPRRFQYVVLTGHTGTGKTRLLHALGQSGAQTLDLEHLSCHRGSLLGALPGQPQPSQKSFESSLVSIMSGFDPSIPVFIEAESRRIGSLDVPKALLESFHRGVCIDVTAAQDDRIIFLLEDYSHLFEQPEYFKHQLTRLTGLHSKATIEHWHALIDADARAQLFTELIAEHYDPAYVRSSYRHFHRLPAALSFKFDPTVENAVEQAQELLRQLGLRSAQDGLPSSMLSHYG